MSLALTLTIVSVRHYIALIGLRGRIGRNLMRRRRPSSSIIATEILVLLILHSLLVSMRLFDVAEGVRSVRSSLILVCLNLKVSSSHHCVLLELLLLL